MMVQHVLIVFYKFFIFFVGLCSYGPETTDTTTKYPSIEFKCSSTPNDITIEYNTLNGKQPVQSTYGVSQFTTTLIAAGVKKYLILLL